MADVRLEPLLLSEKPLPARLWTLGRGHLDERQGFSGSLRAGRQPRLRRHAIVVATIHRLEQLFRRAAGLDLDKSDFDRLEHFVRRKVVDLVVRGEANARANGRDVVQPWDLPITKGLQETIHRFRLVDAELQLTDYLAGLTRLPPTELAIGDETEERFPEIAGALCIALAETFRITNADLENPTTEDWERADRLFGLLL